MNYFYFTKGQRRGVIFLILLIIAIIFLKYII